MKETNITYFRDVIGIGALYIYAVAFLYTLFYYNAFGINIIHYISLTEILLEMITLFMATIVNIVIIEFITFLIFIPVNKYMGANNKYIKYGMLIQIVILSILVVLRIWVIRNAAFDVIMALILVLILLKFFLPKTKIFEKNTGIRHWGLYIFVFLLACFFCFYGLSHGEKTKNGQYDSSVIYNVITTDNEYTNKSSSDAPIFVGENNAAIFLYDKNEKKSIIINRQQVVESTFKNTRNGESIGSTRWFSLPEHFTFIRF